MFVAVMFVFSLGSQRVQSVGSPAFRCRRQKLRRTADSFDAKILLGTVHPNQWIGPHL